MYIIYYLWVLHGKETFQMWHCCVMLLSICISHEFSSPCTTRVTKFALKPGKWKQKNGKGNNIKKYQIKVFFNFFFQWKKFPSIAGDVSTPSVTFMVILVFQLVGGHIFRSLTLGPGSSHPPSYTTVYRDTSYLLVLDTRPCELAPA